MIWTKSDIRTARKSELAPLLIERGYRLLPANNGNFRILPDPDDPSVPAGLVVKQSFWVWNDRNISGNAIDFFTKVEGKSFHQAMEIILVRRNRLLAGGTAGVAYDSSEQILPEERGNVVKTAR